MVIKKIWRVLNSELIKAILRKDPWLKGHEAIDPLMVAAEKESVPEFVQNKL